MFDATVERARRLHLLRSIAGCVALFLIPLLVVAPSVCAQTAAATEILRQSFVDHAFDVSTFGAARWLNGEQAYTTLEPSAESTKVKELVRYDVATGKRDVLVTAQQLTPPGAQEPLLIENYSWSSDLSRLLIFTNSKRVWRAHTRGDYWVLDRKSGHLQKLGTGGPPSTLMFAKFSPDASKVAYVRFNNIFVEDLAAGKSWRLTSDGSEKIINGTSDWVYEEEFFIRDAFRWSPDGTRIAYWQFDTSKVKNFPLLYDAGAPYEVLTHIPYPDYGVYPTVRQIPIPQPGTENSSVRVGVIPALGGETRWMDVPGYADENYIARLDWAGDSDTLMLQHLNRLQNTNDVLLADVKTGAYAASFRITIPPGWKS